MATVYGIEVAGETYDIEDTNAREGVQTNATDIDNIQAVVPSSASASNKLATQDDVPDISIGEAYTDTKQGLHLIIYKSGKTCQFDCKGTYTGTTQRIVELPFAIPATYRPKMAAQGIFAENTIDVPYGQWVIKTDGNIVLYGGNGDIVNNKTYAACGTYLTA